MSPPPPQKAGAKLRKVARGFFRRKARETQRSKSEVPLSRFPLVSLGQLQKTPFDFLDDANRLDPYATLQIPVFSGWGSCYFVTQMSFQPEEK
eukprot:g25990.t1